jgi:hypothetical protein
MDWRLAIRGTKEYKLLSLDVFDTCLIRDFVSQESLWYLVGREIVSQLPGISSPAGFVRLRGRTEVDVRGRAAAEDITLADVYTALALTCGWSPEQQRQALAIEEELELRGLRLNPAVQDLLARADGAPVCYLSDTPHRTAFIRSCLDAQSLPAGPVLSSGDLGLLKGTGSLYREAFKRFGVTPGQLLHVGNNLRADGVGSALAGAAFAPVLAANPTGYEAALDTASRESGGLLGAVLGGVGRDFRLANSGPLASVVSGVAGPVILAATAWTLLSAQRDKVDTLYFAARDGEILLSVARLLQRELGLAAEIDCRYLYGSRKAWHLPALSLQFDLDPAASLRRHLVRSLKETLRGLLGDLDIAAEEVAAITDVSPDARLGDQMTAVIDTLVNSPEFQSLALERAKKAYEATMGYLFQEKMFSGGRVGLVDIGWQGAASASLVAMAAQQGTDVLCYFAGGLCGAGARVAPEDSRAFLINTRTDEPELRASLVGLLETFCAGTGGSTLGYVATDGQYAPRLAPAEGNAAMRWGLPDYQALVCSYAASVCRSLAKFGWTPDVDEVEALRPYLIANLRRLWNFPTYEEAELWGSFPFESENRIDLLGRAITVGDVVGFPFRRFQKPGQRQAIGVWKRAALARTLGSRRFKNPLAFLRVRSRPQLGLLKTNIRSRLALRPTVRLADVHIRNGKVTVR